MQCANQCWYSIQVFSAWFITRVVTLLTHSLILLRQQKPVYVQLLVRMFWKKRFVHSHQQKFMLPFYRDSYLITSSLHITWVYWSYDWAGTKYRSELSLYFLEVLFLKQQIKFMCSLRRSIFVKFLIASSSACTFT